MERKKVIKRFVPRAARKPGENRGRPSKYDPKFAKIADMLCSRGATDGDLATAFNVSTETIKNWCSYFPEFGKAVLHGKTAVFDPLVERALAQRAIGYSVDTEEVKVFLPKDARVDEKGDPIPVEVRTKVRKHYAPDPTSCIFWLKNRHPEAWRDVHKIEHEGEVSLKSLTSEQLLEQIKQDALELGLLPEVPKKSTGLVLPAKSNGKLN